MRRKNKGPCITFHLNAVRRSANMPGRALARPRRRLGSRTGAGKANKFGFFARTPGLKFRKCGPGAYSSRYFG